MGKTIEMTLDPDSIDKAIAELDKYRDELKRKTAALQERITNELATYVQAVFANAVVEDRINQAPKMADVQVEAIAEPDEFGISVVIAHGTDAVWVEFGAGVYHNGPIGQSPHPWVEQNRLPFYIGSMSYGRGGGKAWGFYENGTLILTHGTPASMPFFNGLEALCREIDRIAVEVFSS